jgi:hypothetical protein
MKNLLPRVGFEKFECFEDGSLIDPSNENAIDQAIMFRWAFVIGFGEKILWSIVEPKEKMQRYAAN